MIEGDLKGKLLRRISSIAKQDRGRTRVVSFELFNSGLSTLQVSEANNNTMEF